MTHRFFLISCLLCLLSCNNPPSLFTSVTVMYDTTEKTFLDSAYYQKRIPELMRFIIPDSIESINNGGEIELSALNDISQNQTYGATLKPVKDKWGVNPYVREEQIIQFKQETKSAFDIFYKYHSKDTIDHSKIYQGLCHAVGEIKDDVANKRVIVIFSDFLEHSDLFSFYGKGNPEFLQDPVRFYEINLKTHCQLPPMKDIEVYLITPFRNEKNDEMINKALSFWKKILEYQGAKVKTGVSLPSIQ
jgi:hypothetical protein